MNKKLLITILTFSLFGCVSLADVDTSKKNPNCVRQCSTTYSSCVSGGNQVGFKTETLRACQESYKVCIQTCPAK